MAKQTTGAADDERTVWVVTGAGGHLGSHVLRTLCGSIAPPPTVDAAAAVGEDGTPRTWHHRIVSVVSARPDASLPLAARPESAAVAPVTIERGDVSDPVFVRTLLRRCVSDTGRELATAADDCPRRSLSQRVHVVVIHCAAVTNVNLAFAEPAVATAANVEATQGIADALAAVGDDAASVGLVYVSTDMVFDGRPADPTTGFRTTDPPGPLSHYGRTKAAGEAAALSLNAPTRGAPCPPRALVVRVPLMCGSAWGSKANDGTFAAQVRGLRAAMRPPLRDGDDDATAAATPPPVKGFVDEFRTPLPYTHAAWGLVAAAAAVFRHADVSSRLAHTVGAPTSVGSTTSSDDPAAASAAASLLSGEAPAVLHLAGRDRLSRRDVLLATFAALKGAGEFAEAAVPPVDTVVGSSRQADVPGPEPRSADLSLDSSLFDAVVGPALAAACRPRFADAVTVALVDMAAAAAVSA